MPLLKKYQFRPGFVGTIIAFIGTGCFLALMFWQLGRADEKRDLQTLIDDRLNKAAVIYQGGPLNLDEMRYRELKMSGQFKASKQVMLDNIVFEGKPGYEVITPFLLDSGKYVLINRGWVPQGQLRSSLPNIDINAKPVSISGRVEKHRSRPVIVSDDMPIHDDQKRWLYINRDIYKKFSGLELPDFIVRLNRNNPGVYQTSDTPFDAKVAMHIGYAIQWGAFGLIAFGTWLGVSFKSRK